MKEEVNMQKRVNAIAQSIENAFHGEEKWEMPLGFDAVEDLKWCNERLEEDLSDLDREYLIERMYNAGMHLFNLLNKKKDNDLESFLNLKNWKDSKLLNSVKKTK